MLYEFLYFCIYDSTNLMSSFWCRMERPLLQWSDSSQDWYFFDKWTWMFEIALLVNREIKVSHRVFPPDENIYWSLDIEGCMWIQQHKILSS